MKEEKIKDGCGEKISKARTTRGVKDSLEGRKHGKWLQGRMDIKLNCQRGATSILHVAASVKERFTEYSLCAVSMGGFPHGFPMK